MLTDLRGMGVDPIAPSDFGPPLTSAAAPKGRLQDAAAAHASAWPK